MLSRDRPPVQTPAIGPTLAVGPARVNEGEDAITSTRIRRAAIAAGLLVGALGPALGAGAAIAVAAGAPPGASVRHETLTFVDRSRPTKDPVANRSAPTRTLVTEVYAPAGRGPFPLVLLAHGANGDPAKLSQLLEAWAGAGYVAAAPAFPLTNDLSGGPSIVGDYVNQPQDLHFVLDQLLRLSRRRGSPLSGRIDPKHIGAAGFSLGGGTVYGWAFNACCRDRRIDAVLLMDAVRVPFAGRPFHIRGPVMFVHIRTDVVVPYAQSAASYAEAVAPKIFMTIDQGIHFEPYENFPSPSDGVVQAATIRFWNLELRHRGTIGSVVRAGTRPGISSVTAKARPFR